VEKSKYWTELYHHGNFYVAYLGRKIHIFLIGDSPRGAAYSKAFVEPMLHPICRAAVGMGIPMGMGVGWVWGL